MCVVIGMAEVNTCDIRVYEGQHVTKGEEVGMFISVA
jgi:phosphatidylserine decarboxylase